MRGARLPAAQSLDYFSGQSLFFRRFLRVGQFSGLGTPEAWRKILPSMSWAGSAGEKILINRDTTPSKHVVSLEIRTTRRASERTSQNRARSLHFGLAPFSPVCDRSSPPCEMSRKPLGFPTRAAIACVPPHLVSSRRESFPALCQRAPATFHIPG